MIINKTALLPTLPSIRLIIYLLTPFLLYGCLGTQARVNWDNTYSIPVNSTISLLQPLTIPAQDTQVFIQYGKAVYSTGYTYGYDQYYPFCFFEVQDIAETEQTILADNFTITEVYRDETEFVQTTPTRMASLITVSGDYGISIIVQTMTMKLHSDKQPGVSKLVCGGGFDLPPFAELPTIKEIEEALGDIAQLKIQRAPANTL